jgi:hypothetical protein
MYESLLKSNTSKPQAAIVWNDHLAAEFEEAECTADVICTTLNIDMFQNLSATIAEMRSKSYLESLKATRSCKRKSTGWAAK